MRKFFNYCFFAIALLSIFQSCKKSDNNSNPSTGTYSWSCKLDGTTYSWSGAGEDSTGGGGAFRNFPITDTIVPLAIDLGKGTGQSDNEFSIIFYSTSSNAGTYTLTGNNPFPSTLLIIGNGSAIYNTRFGGSVTLNITSITSTQCSGTFSGSIKNIITGATGNITEGKFSIPIRPNP